MLKFIIHVICLDLVMLDFGDRSVEATHPQVEYNESWNHWQEDCFSGSIGLGKVVSHLVPWLRHHS